MKTSLIHWNAPAKAEEARQHRGKNRRKSWLEWFHAVLNRIAPMGYEDDEGFHYGKPPVRPPGDDWLS